MFVHWGCLMMHPVWPDRARLQQQDLRLALALNRTAAWPGMGHLCRLVSRLGDGGLWYGVIALLPLAAGPAGLQCALQMLAAGTIALLVYVGLKHGIGRARPFESCPHIRLHGKALDRFSFPSGHTLHATVFALVLTYHFPLAALPLIPFTLLIAVSRVALGLHYPSDVAAAALLGTLIGLGAVYLI